MAIYNKKPASNLLQASEEVRERVRKGYPNGVDEQSALDIPNLLKRIDQLERTLMPFARIGRAEPAVGKAGPDKLVHCKLSSCIAADKALDEKQQPQNTEPKDFGMFAAD